MDFKEKLSNTGNYIANNKKALFYVGGAIAVVVIGYTVVKALKNTIKGDKIVGGKFNPQIIDKSKTTISEEQAKNYAENLFEAFNYTWGTDKAIISQIFTKIKAEDFKMIYNAFGTRSYSEINGGTPSGKIFAPDHWVGFTDKDLVGWLNTELGITDFLLRNKIKPIVTQAGFILA